MIDAISVTTFRRRIMADAVRSERPAFALFEITPTCNLRCSFCFVALEPYAGPYLGTDEMRAALDKLADAGVLYLTLTGGEIFSRRDFADIYRHAVSRGFLITLFTNATMATERIRAVLAEHPPFAIEASIYGADAEHYERVTGIPGSFAKFEQGIARLQSLGVDMLIKHPVTRLTVDHLDAIRAWTSARGLKLKITTDIENQHDGGTTPSLYRIAPRRANAVKDELHRLRTGRERDLPMAECAVVDEADGADASERLYRCAAGRAGVFIDANGRISHCVWDREPSYPLLEMSWQDIHASMLAWVNQPLPDDAPCSGCGVRSGCNNCPARARLATGSPYLKDPYQCETTQSAYAERAVALRAPALATRPLAGCAR